MLATITGAVDPGKGNVILFPPAEDRIGGREGGVQCRERLGGLLKYYRRAGCVTKPCGEQNGFAA
jgi:hypothetical protein